MEGHEDLQFLQCPLEAEVLMTEETKLNKNPAAQREQLQSIQPFSFAYSKLGCRRLSKTFQAPCSPTVLPCSSWGGPEVFTGHTRYLGPDFLTGTNCNHKNYVYDLLTALQLMNKDTATKV